MNRSGRQRSFNTRSSNTGRGCEPRFYDLRLCATDELLCRSCVGRTRGMFAECSCYLPCRHCARAHTAPRGTSGSPSFKSRKILSEGDGHYGFRLPLPDCRAAFKVHYRSAVYTGPQLHPPSDHKLNTDQLPVVLAWAFVDSNDAHVPGVGARPNGESSDGAVIFLFWSVELVQMQLR